MPPDLQQMTTLLLRVSSEGHVGLLWPYFRQLYLQIKCCFFLEQFGKDDSCYIQNYFCIHPNHPPPWKCKSVQPRLPLIYYFLQCFTLFISIILFSRLWVHHWLDVLSFFLQASLSSSVLFTDELTWISLAYKTFLFFLELTKCDFT